MEPINIESPLVSTSWLKKHYSHPDLVILDASWFLPGIDRDAISEWQNERIPGARFFDFGNVICDINSELAHMLPSEEYFSEQVGLLGISNDTKIVVYDSHGIFSAPRVWWMFRVMGHIDVAVLDGGFPAWKETSSLLEKGAPTTPVPRNYKAQLNSNWVKDIKAVNSYTKNSDIVIIDARNSERFKGKQKESRPNLRSGHIPSAKNLPFLSLLDDNKFKPIPVLNEAFANVCDEHQQLVFSCGSGVTACILALASTLCNKKQISVYDGSWSEWGMENGYPIEI